MRDRDQQKLEAVQLRALLQQRNRLLTIWAIVVDEGDLLALEVVHAAQLVGDVLDGNIRGGPIRAEGVEIPGEHRSIAAIGSAITSRQQRNFVAGRLFSQGERNARWKGRERSSARRTWIRQTLVALNALDRGVTRFAYLLYALHAFD